MDRENLFMDIVSLLLTKTVVKNERVQGRRKPFQVSNHFKVEQPCYSQIPERLTGFPNFLLLSFFLLQSEKITGKHLVFFREGV